MMVFTLCLFATLAKTPDAALREPTPPEGFHRLHPRTVTATSVLRDNVYRFEQNYLPVYVADDAPNTAWVEGVKGNGIGESLTWLGPPLSKVKAVKIYVRNGLQASRKLFDANARIRKLRLEALARGAAGTLQPSATPQELELKSQTGWQAVDLQVSGPFAGLRLTILSAYAGTVYEDTCLSDLQVWVQGDDEFNAAAETAALDTIRTFIASRAELKPKLASAWAPKRIASVSQEVCKGAGFADCLELLAQTPALTTVAKHARALAERVYDALVDPHSLGAPWRPVTVGKGERHAELEGVLAGDHSYEMSPSAVLDRRSLVLKPSPPKRTDSDEVKCERGFQVGPMATPSALVVNSCYEIDGRSATSYENGTSLIALYNGDLAQALIEVDPPGAVTHIPVMRLLSWHGAELASVVTFDFGQSNIDVHEWVAQRALSAPQRQ